MGIKRLSFHPSVDANCREKSESTQGDVDSRRDTESGLLNGRGHNDPDAPKDVFGDETGAEVKYKTCSWFHVALFMIAETISLGVLALPQAVATLGLVPGLLSILALGIIATYTGYVIGQYKIAFPDVTNFADAGMKIAGPWGREIMAVSQLLILIFIMAAHIVSFAKMMNVLTAHATCTIAFSVLGTVVSFLFGLPRKLEAISWTSAVSCISIVVAVLVTLGSIAHDKPDMGNVHAVTSVPFIDGWSAVLTMVLAYAGHVAFFNFCAEMAEPREFPKAVIFMVVTTCSFYLVIASVIYYYAGAGVASPALSSANPLIAKIAWGIAAPTIVIAGVINGAVGAKYIYVRFFPHVLHEKTFRAYAPWYAINFGLWLVAWIIAESIPNFNLLLEVIAALFCSWFSYGLPGGLWLHMNYGRWTVSWRKTTLTMVNMGILLLGAVICVVGLWSSITKLSQGKGGECFSCADTREPNMIDH